MRAIKRRREAAASWTMLATGWDKGGIFAADVSSVEPREDSNVVIERKFREFLENFRTARSFVYR